MFLLDQQLAALLYEEWKTWICRSENSPSFLVKNIYFVALNDSVYLHICEREREREREREGERKGISLPFFSLSNKDLDLLD